MIKQCGVTDIESRLECNPFDSTGFLPLIVAPMYSCVDKHNAHIFLENKIKVCMPRKEYMDETYTHCSNENYFDSYSLQEFIELFIDSKQGFLNDSNFNKVKTSVCIDTAAGHLKKLHEVIRKAKEIHGDSLIVMAGNVGSVEAFVELAKTGVDYIRVGIGGGGGCNTTSNTGVGQEDLCYLIEQCSQVRLKYKNSIDVDSGFRRVQNWLSIANVKIVADGISSWIKHCEKEYGFNDNGYAAINKLLYAGADLVMIGKLFAQCLESAGKKEPLRELKFTKVDSSNPNIFYSDSSLFVRYSGMSTKSEQEKYKNDNAIKPSEGSINWIPVKWTLKEWLNGSDNQDQYPYLMGWVNSCKSMMSYIGKTKL